MSNPSSSARAEALRLARQALPVVATQLATMMLGVVDTIMVGRLGVDAIGAASLGNVWVMGTLIVGMGVISGIDPFVSQAHGARDPQRMGAALQQGLALSLLLSVPVALLWLITEPVLRAAGQDPVLAATAHRYVLVQLPGIPAFLAFMALRAYLFNRGYIWPAFWVALAANGVNAGLNWIFIWGKFGAPALGTTGAGLATGLTRLFLLAALAIWILAAKLHRGAWVGWERSAIRRVELWAVLAIGLPIGIQLGLEIWAFQISTLMAGRLGAAELAAGTIVLNLASLSFMMPLGIAIAAAARIGNLIGAGEPQQAQRAAWVAFALGAAVMGAAALLFIVGRQHLPALYSRDATTLVLAAAVLPVAAAFQLFDGLQVVGGGVLRGMGRPRPAAVFNLVGYYALAIPLAWLLGFHTSLRLIGVWTGLALGLAAIALALIVWVWRRGPARVDARLRWDRSN